MTTIPNTTPYAWPFDGNIDARSTALVIAGAGPSWAPFVPTDDVIVRRIHRLRTDLAAAGVLIVVVEHEFDSSRLLPANDPAPALQATGADVSIAAVGIDGFYGSPLDAVLRRYGRDHLIVCGYGLETTVHSTVRRANDRGYECLTIIDASVPHVPDLAAAARSSVEMSGGIFGAIGTTHDVLTAYPTT